MADGDPAPKPPRKGLSTGAIVAIIIVAVILLLFGTCLAIVNSSGFG